MFWLLHPVVIMKEIISWLFKDPILVTVDWTNLDNTQQNIKKWPKKIRLPQIRFFLEKKNI